MYANLTILKWYQFEEVFTGLGQLCILLLDSNSVLLGRVIQTELCEVHMCVVS